MKIIITHFLFLIFLTHNLFALKPDSVYKVRPENYDLIYKELNIVTSDGYKIKTWFYPAQKLNHDIQQGWPYFTGKRRSHTDFYE
jgi:hypothetical protein